MTWRFPLILLTCAVGLASPGCKLFAGLVQVLPPPTKTVKAEFDGLAGHSVAIVVYVDRGTEIEYPTVRGEIAMELGAQLQKNVKNCFITDPSVVISYQDKNIEWDLTEKTKLCKTFQVDYLLYVSVNTFSTHEPGDRYMFQGQINADVSLYDAHKKEREAVVWKGRDIKSSFPSQPAPYAIDDAPRQGAIAKFADIVARKFYTYKEEVK